MSGERNLPGGDGRRLLLLDERDNVLLATGPFARGEVVAVDGILLTIGSDLALGHKVARRAISPGETVLKYGAPIGVATAAISPGAHVHVHNIASNYTATHTLDAARDAARTGEAL